MMPSGVKVYLASQPVDFRKGPDSLLSLVRDAGQLAQRMRTAGVEAHAKTSPSDVVTAADLAAEELVVGRLRSERPDDGIVGEEGAHREGTSGRTWVIDPVDGTYNFSTGSDYWCSALALVEGEPEDYNHGPFAYVPGLIVVNLRKVTV